MMDAANDQPTQARWQQVERLFLEALACPAGKRVAFLSAACADDAALAKEVTVMLAAHEEAGDDYLEALDADQATALLHATDAPEPGTIGSYRIVDELGRGGMGTVYLAERADGQFDQQVALKLVKRGMDSEAVLRRFLSERQILARLHHPHIARLLDGGVSEEGQPYFAMEQVEGCSITRYCNENRLSIEDRLCLFVGVCEAVHYAHRNLVIHRDLKPSNILVTANGQVKLLDFGIAKVFRDGDEPEKQTLTEIGFRAMTPEYAAPEQVRSEPITTATDVYALGVVLYELLTGRLPYHFDQRTPEAIAQVVSDTEPDRPSTAISHTWEDETGATVTPETVSRQRASNPAALRRRLAGDLDTVVLKALRHEPEQRYASAEAFAEDIKRHLAGLPVKARPQTMRYRAWTFVRRHRVSAAASVVLVFFLIFYAVTFFVQAQRIAEEAARTEQVKDFLTSLFTRANPGVSQGGELTALELVEEGARRVETELGGEPELQAELMTVLGELFGALGRYEAAAAQLGPALEIRRHLLGPWHEEVARTAHALGFSLHHQGRYAAAEAPFREALAIRGRLFGEQSREVALTLDQLGDLLHSRGELMEAEKVLRQALAIGVAEIGEPHLAVAQHHLANVRRDRGAVEEAETLYRRSLAISTEHYGPVHPVTAITRSELALLLAETRRHEEAEALLEENFRDYAQLYPRGHAMEGTTFRNLGVLRLRQGRLAEAREALERCLANYRHTLSEQHALVPRARRYLAEATLALGDTEGAIALAEEALDDLRGLGLTGHPAVADALETMALARMAQGFPAEAVDLLSEAISIRMRISIASDPRVEITREWLDEARARAAAAAEISSRVPSSSQTSTGE